MSSENNLSGKAGCDLHTHSVFSDGTYTPAEIIKEAEALGLSAVALCDHNTTGGLAEFTKAAEGSCAEAIAAVEISTDYLGHELHIIAMFLDACDYQKVEALLEEYQKRKAASNLELEKALLDSGYKIDCDALHKRAGGSINRVHYAEELMRCGYVKSIKEAISTLLSKGGGFYREPKKLDAIEVIRYIKSIGAVAVLAHPFLSLCESELREFLKLAAPAGLDAMEVLYSTYDAKTEKLAKAVASEFGILPSGGSDFHGARKPGIKLAHGPGNLFIPMEYCDALRKRRKSPNHSEDL